MLVMQLTTGVAIRMLASVVLQRWDNTFGRALVTTGSNNTILGAYNGNQGGLDIRTSSNNIVLSDGDGNPRLYIDSTTWTALHVGRNDRATLVDLVTSTVMTYLESNVCAGDGQ
jgi:hypothetical protein